MPATLRSLVTDLVHNRSPATTRGSRSGLTLKVARNVDEVIAAWQRVYRSYLRIGIVLANEFGIHTVPHAIHPDTSVVYGLLGDDPEVCATISSYVDRPGGLPLDEVYGRELAAMRAEGRSLVEVGLLADRRKDPARSLDATLELMKYAFFHGVYSGATDLVIGVHPHHAGFYERLFAFEPFGEESFCPLVNDAPVIGLRLKLEEKLRLDPLPRGLRFFVRSPVDPEVFDGRVELTRHAIRGTIIEPFLRMKERYIQIVDERSPRVSA